VAEDAAACAIFVLFHSPFCYPPSMTTLDSALAILRAHAPDLRARGVAHAAIFGSVARGDADARSDVDVLVELDQEKRISLFRLCRPLCRYRKSVSGKSRCRQCQDREAPLSGIDPERSGLCLLNGDRVRRSRPSKTSWTISPPFAALSRTRFQCFSGRQANTLRRNEGAGDHLGIIAPLARRFERPSHAHRLARHR
jgi:hypothetical protein